MIKLHLCNLKFDTSISMELHGFYQNFSETIAIMNLEKRTYFFKRLIFKNYTRHWLKQSRDLKLTNCRNKAERKKSPISCRKM